MNAMVGSSVIKVKNSLVSRFTQCHDRTKFACFWKVSPQLHKVSLVGHYSKKFGSLSSKSILFKAICIVERPFSLHLKFLLTLMYFLQTIYKRACKNMKVANSFFWLGFSILNLFEPNKFSFLLSRSIFELIFVFINYPRHMKSLNINCFIFSHLQGRAFSNFK